MCTFGPAHLINTWISYSSLINYQQFLLIVKKMIRSLYKMVLNDKILVQNGVNSVSDLVRFSRWSCPSWSSDLCAYTNIFLQPVLKCCILECSLSRAVPVPQKFGWRSFSLIIPFFLDSFTPLGTFHHIRVATRFTWLLIKM